MNVLNLKLKVGFVTILLITVSSVFAQTGIVRGVVFNKETGEPVPFCTVLRTGTTHGVTTDIDGFYTLTNLPNEKINLTASGIGYDSLMLQVDLSRNQIVQRNFLLEESGIELEAVNISARSGRQKTETRVSVIEVTPAEIQALPSTGGDADIAQYLTVIPGVISTGDQGGQIYIRGGSPAQTLVLLDNTTIYRPFHSIGLYSVFETEAVQSMEVYSGGFNAEYGGRSSAVIDISTRQGNKKRFAGLVGASPFQGRVMLEGPLNKFSEESPASASFMLSGKTSLIDQTSKSLYEYASPDSNGLPFDYTDLYGKISLYSDNGSSIDLFGFNFTDKVKYAKVSDVEWKSFGAGLNFSLIPPYSNLIFDGTLSYSNYGITFENFNTPERTNDLTDLNIKLNFKYFGYRNELNYGVDVNAVSTDFSFTNFLGLNFDQKTNNTNLAAYIKYKMMTGRLIVEPGLRAQYYASQSHISLEPRLGLKYNVTDQIRVKFAGGLYSQNLFSTVNERDIVNLFFGYLTSPDGLVYQPGSTVPTDHNLIKMSHLVAGLEIDVNRQLSINIEPYYKRFNQLIALNRNKTSVSDLNYITETGDARGIDLSLSYRRGPLDVWLTYSLAEVLRNDGIQEYPANFDRRHNVNVLTSYSFGRDRSWSTSLRWNLGSGFPFTQVIGYYGNNTFYDVREIDYIENNADLTPVFSDVYNGGRLPYYHRLDFSLQMIVEFSKYIQLKIIGSVTNVYDRNNIYYLDILTLDRVDQFPILPSVGVELKF